MSDQTMLVRLKPFNKKLGHVIRRYMIGRMRFDVHRGWYSVPADVAERLRGIRQIQGDADSPAAFDVCTQDEARKIDAREAVKNQAAPATSPNPIDPKAGAMTTADLRKPPEAAPNTGAISGVDDDTDDQGKDGDKGGGDEGDSPRRRRRGN